MARSWASFDEINSTATGKKVLAMLRPAFSSESRKPFATIVRVSGGSGRSLKFNSVIMPSVPWLRVNNLQRSYPATFLTTFPPALICFPSASTTRIPITKERSDP